MGATRSSVNSIRCCTDLFLKPFSVIIEAPLASALCNRWGCRIVGIVGSFLASAAIAASIFSPNIYTMWLLFGFIGGMGMGLVYLPSLVMIGHYFEENRAIAMGNAYNHFRCGPNTVLF